MHAATTLLTALAALAGCAAAAPRAEAGAEAAAGPPAQRPAPAVATAPLGGTARLGGVAVRPLALIEDSRCPPDVTCIWAGRLRLKAAVSGVAGEAELVLGTPFALPGGGTLTLVAAPRPATRFTFRRD